MNAMHTTTADAGERHVQLLTRAHVLREMRPYPEIFARLHGEFNRDDPAIVIYLRELERASS